MEYNMAAQIIQIEDHYPHYLSEVICIKCYKRWYACRPVYTLLKELVCPDCNEKGYAIETGQPIGEEYLKPCRD